MLRCNSCLINGSEKIVVQILGAVFLTLTILLVFGGSIYMATNSNRRAKVLSLFRRRNVSVQYSRVCILVVVFYSVLGRCFFFSHFSCF